MAHHRLRVRGERGVGDEAELDLAGVGPNSLVMLFGKAKLN